jgi:hypothetical protein
VGRQPRRLRAGRAGDVSVGGGARQEESRTLWAKVVAAREHERCKLHTRAVEREALQAPSPPPSPRRARASARVRVAPGPRAARPDCCAACRVLSALAAAPRRGPCAPRAAHCAGRPQLVAGQAVLRGSAAARRARAKAAGGADGSGSGWGSAAAGEGLERVRTGAARAVGQREAPLRGWHGPRLDH